LVKGFRCSNRMVTIWETSIYYLSAKVDDEGSPGEEI